MTARNKIKKLLKEDININSPIKMKLNMLKVKDDIFSAQRNYVQRVLEIYSFINNGFKYDWDVNRPGVQNIEIDDEMKREALKMATHHIKKSMQKMIAEIGSVLGCEEEQEEHGEEEVEVKVISPPEIKREFFHY
jgi:hypothetical protein